MKQYVLCFLLGCFLIAACSKNESTQSNMELITMAAWKYDTAAIDLNMDGAAETPLPPGLILNCESDNTVTLNTDGTGLVDEGATTCNAGDPQTTAITWSFKNNETIINIPDTIFGNISGDAQVKILTATKLQLQKQVQVDLGIPVTVNVIVDLKH